MKWYSVLALLFLVAVISVRADDEESGEDDGLAQPCDAEACQLPDCRCSSTDVPGGLNPRDTPQFVTVTFDDGVNVNNIETYRRLVYNRRNSNGCAAGATFYVNHEYTNYQLVNELYNNGFEIALHSITHLNSQEYWADASYETMKEEFADQMIMMSHFANIPYSSLTGMRIPFLQMGGNSSFEVMHDYGLKYDCSMPTIAYTNPGLWPYTLDYMSTQDCIIPPCPTASIPGVWVYPMIAWTDLQGFSCSFVDSCFAPPDLQDEEAWFKFILSNFEKHYLGNRAPFGFFVHEWFLSINPAVLNAFNRFLNLINSLEDVFMVNSDEVIEWVKNPVPIPEYKQQACPTFIPTTCSPALCPLDSDHNDIQYWMSICNVCPQKYPWIGNPLGQ